MSNLTPLYEDDTVDSVLETQNITNISNPLKGGLWETKSTKTQKGKSLFSEEAQVIDRTMLSYKEDIESQKVQALMLFYTSKVHAIAFK